MNKLIEQIKGQLEHIDPIERTKAERNIMSLIENSTEEKTKINVQVWKSGANAWDDCKPVALEVANPVEVAKSIVRVTGQQVRLTYPFGGITDVGRLNGHYIHPNDLRS
jgi:hypothetical protein